MPLSKAVASLRQWICGGEEPAPSMELVRAARSQGLSAHVAGPAGVWDSPLREAVIQDARAFLVDGVRKLEVAQRTLSRLAERGVRALPLKGAALAEGLYGSVAERPMADVDLLALDSFDEGVMILRQAGFELVEEASHAHAFADPCSAVVVELHSSLTSCPGFFPFDSEALWKRSRAASGQIARVPSLEDLLVQLSVHAAFQHGLVLSLVQWLDFRRVLEREDLDPGAVLERARESNGESSLAAALAVANAVVKAPLPAVLGELVGTRLPAWVRPRLASPLRFVSPESPRVARVRWELARGRRLDLLRGTFPRKGPRFSWGHAHRAGALVRRFGLAFFS